MRSRRNHCPGSIANALGLESNALTTRSPCLSQRALSWRPGISTLHLSSQWEIYSQGKKTSNYTRKLRKQTKYLSLIYKIAWSCILITKSLSKLTTRALRVRKRLHWTGDWQQSVVFPMKLSDSTYLKHTETKTKRENSIYRAFSPDVTTAILVF